MASPLTIQPSSKDNFIYSGTATTNYGTLAYVQTYTNVGAVPQRPLIEFVPNWGTDPPAGATISNATLYLYYYDVGLLDPVGRTINCYRLLRTDWHETQSTWNIYKTSNNWTTAGAGSDGNDYTTTNMASAVIPASYGWMSWDVTEQVKTAQTGSINVEFELRDSVENSATAYYPSWYSKDYTTDTTKCPKLIITYTTSTNITITLAATADATGAGVAPISIIDAIVTSVMAGAGVIIEPALNLISNPTVTLAVSMAATAAEVEPTLSLSSAIALLTSMQASAELIEPTLFISLNQYIALLQAMQANARLEGELVQVRIETKTSRDRPGLGRGYAGRVGRG
jgi:hypothetical protein